MDAVADPWHEKQAGAPTRGKSSITRGTAAGRIPCLSPCSFFFFFNELERRREGAEVLATETARVAKTARPVAKTG
ncbi:hypothetical protein [Burkholderia stagnalis]|uniref:hypothetical protein n=1 Tax=Burkholderia stagnalis TaxID=1503054 RepID=UPI0012D95EF9|nr:hypothetical protein [Burkholderia stagnalis]